MTSHAELTYPITTEPASLENQVRSRADAERVFEQHGDWSVQRDGWKADLSDDEMIRIARRRIAEHRVAEHRLSLTQRMTRTGNE